MDPDKFAKVLALAESDHQGEALSALRAARVMLARAGMTLRDLAGLLKAEAIPVPTRVDAPPSPRPPTDLAMETADDEARNGTHQRTVQDMEIRIRSLEQRVERQNGELERQRAETQRWRKLAQETADRLWDLGKALEARPAGQRTPDRRQTIIEYLRDPARAQLADREIARQIGVPSQAVTYWRRRIAIETRHQLRGRIARRSRRSRRHRSAPWLGPAVPNDGNQGTRR